MAKPKAKKSKSSKKPKAKAKPKSPRKANSFVPHILLIRYVGSKPNPAFTDGWATLQPTGWTSGFDLDVKDNFLALAEIDDAIDDFLESQVLFPHSRNWEFRVVVPWAL